MFSMFRQHARIKALEDSLAEALGHLKVITRELAALEDSTASNFGRLFKRLGRAQKAEEAEEPPHPSNGRDDRPTAAQRFGARRI